MISSSQWNSLLNLNSQDFKHPESLKFAIVKSLDKFVSIVGIRPVILSDYRQDDPKQHGQGNAIDVVFPGGDSTTIYEQALDSSLFGGVGVYLNDAGHVSYHFDSRLLKPDGTPAKWGGLVTHPYDALEETHVKRIEYFGADLVLDMIKKKAFLPGLFLILFGSLIYLSNRR